jgi:dCTP deaminase
MALSDKRILKEMELGNIVIHPFDDKNLSSSSYDITLGEYYYKCSTPKNKHLNHVRIYNPYSEGDVNKIWKLNKAVSWSELSKRSCLIEIGTTGSSVNGENISDDDLVILIGPRESLLCHTNEFIGGRNDITTMMKSRSSFGRNFLESCSCAGWGDVGYVNRWTMEIRNNSEYYTIPLIVGRRIAQIVFLPTGETLKKYPKSGKYQTTENLSELEKCWKPEDMLPKMYLDREINQNKFQQQFTE